MSTIAVLTLNGYYNYGNRLQNYATQEVLKSIGYDVETIINDRTKKTAKRSLMERAFSLRKYSFKQLCTKVDHKLWSKIRKSSIEKRTKIFKQFTRDYITETNYKISEGCIPPDLSDRYDYFITGSDQVWNPANIYGSSIYFLTFAKKHKRIALAPSFGVSKIGPEYMDKYKEWISAIPWLSVREKEGAKIIKELTGRDAPVLVDPTLLLSEEKWLSISKEADNKPKRNYLLSYFLGNVTNKSKRQIQNIVKANNLEIINLGDVREKQTYETGPREFIDYVNSCSILCTDSFHGVIFAILFMKPFIVYDRVGTGPSMYSRINTLLNKFDLNDRKAENIQTYEQVFDVDYSHVPKILKEERDKAFNYLKEALNIKDAPEDLNLF